MFQKFNPHKSLEPGICYAREFVIWHIHICVRVVVVFVIVLWFVRYRTVLLMVVSVYTPLISPCRFTPHHLYLSWSADFQPHVPLSTCQTTVRPSGNHTSLHWRHNERDGVSNHQPHDCLLNGLFRRRSKKTSKLRVSGLCGGIHRWPVNSPHKGPVTRKMFSIDDVTISSTK